MKANELKDKSIEQLNSDLLDLLKAQFGLRMQNATGQLGKSKRVETCTSRYCSY